MLTTLFEESEIVRRSSVLVGFTGETENAIGEIKLPIYTEELTLSNVFALFILYLAIILSKVSVGSMT